MEQLFPNHEADIVPLRPEQFLVVVGSYTGNDDKDTDKINADTELAKLFPDRFQETATVDASANTATLTGAGFDAELIPLVYKNGVLLSEDAYSFVAATGVFSTFDPVLEAGNTVVVTLARFIYGVQSLEYDPDMPVTIKEIKAAGSKDYVYRAKTYEDAKFPLTVNGKYDVRKLRRKYPTMDIEKAVFGPQWVATGGAANEVARNSNPFFVAFIWWMPDAASEELKVEKLVFYKCDLKKGLVPKFEGTDDVASFTIDAEATYAYRYKDLV